MKKVLFRLAGHLHVVLHHGAFRGYRRLPEPPGSEEHPDGHSTAIYSPEMHGEQLWELQNMLF